MLLQRTSTRSANFQRSDRAGPRRPAALLPGHAFLRPRSRRALLRNNAAPGQATTTIVEEHQNGAASTQGESQPASPSSSGGHFAWTKCWYPVAALDNLDAIRPTNVKLLGLNLAVWCDKQGNWQCLEDKCAHRMAPLSEGRVEDGHIMCCYHGWQFDGEGKCSKIPQIDDPKAHAFACSQPSSRVRPFPTKAEFGLLWVWPESGLDALLESSQAPLRIAVPPDTEKGKWNMPYTWFVRDLPLRFDTATENLMDISHAPHAHHGVPGMGNRNKLQKFSYVKDGASDKEMGFVLDLKQQGLPFSFKVSFKPPSFIRHAGAVFTNEIIVVPTQPGWSRVFMGNLFLGDAISKLPLPIRVIGAMKVMFPALDHVLLKHAIFDGDTYMLHLAERELLRVDNNWRQNFFMPAADDLPIVTFRRWLQDFGGDVPTLGPLSAMPPAMTKEQTMDRYQEHTRHCPHCQKALAFLQAGTVASLAAAVLAAVVVVSKVLAGAPLLQPATLVGAAAAAACCALASFLNSFKAQFHYVDYVHAHKD